jgi:hypothetical protein
LPKDLDYASIVKKWVTLGLETAPVKRRGAERAMATLYHLAGLKTPKILWEGSPYTAMLVADNLTKDEVTPAQHLTAEQADIISAREWSHVEKEIKSRVALRVRTLVAGLIENAIAAKVWTPVADPARFALWPLIRTVGPTNANNVRYGQSTAPALVRYDVYAAMGVTLDARATAWVTAMKALARTGWWIPYQTHVVMAERPCGIHLDEAGALHDEDGLALEYVDGWGIRATHGVQSGVSLDVTFNHAHSSPAPRTGMLVDGVFSAQHAALHA